MGVKVFSQKQIRGEPKLELDEVLSTSKQNKWFGEAVKSEEELNLLFNHHAPSSQFIADTHTHFRHECKVLAEVINEVVPAGREQALAFTNLEQVMFWGNAAIAREGAKNAG